MESTPSIALFNPDRIFFVSANLKYSDIILIYHQNEIICVILKIVNIYIISVIYTNIMFIMPNFAGYFSLLYIKRGI